MSDLKESEGGVEQVPVFALVGNPNCGKTTLFNALTGLRQKVGNYPGVTVERKEGTCFTQHGKKIRILDLPGSYSLNARSPDEKILLDALLGRIRGEALPDGIICCLDASNLERNLFLASQVMALGRPTLIVLNMMDVALRRGMRIDVERLSEHLGVPVLPCEASSGKGLVEIRLALSRKNISPARPLVGNPELFEQAVHEMAPSLRRGGLRDAALAEGEAALLLSGEPHLNQTSPESTRTGIWQQRFDREMPGWRSQLITMRYSWIGDVMRDTVRRFNPNRPGLTERIDRFLLHPVYGFLSLGLVMGLLFYSIFSLAAPLMDATDSGFSTFGSWVSKVLPEGQLTNLLVDGAISGVGGVVIFLPQILLLFFFISLLESTGYMARAAFILDRLMSKAGLHGRSFIPLLSSYACAVPGIMATRTIESPKDRLATILVAPFMSCSARLPVYLIMIAALLPDGRGHAGLKALLLLGLYSLGTASAFLAALCLKKTLLRGASPSLVMELPSYKLPQLSHVFMEMYDRACIFLRRAGTIIFGLSILLWFSMNYPQVPTSEVPASERVELREAEWQLENSFAGRLGKTIEPVFAPIGYDWKITVGLIAAFAAREVFVSTLAIIYAVEADAEGSLLDAIRSQQRADGSKLFTPLTCISILIFFVYALQCMSTVAVVRRETQSWRWALFQFASMFIVAWSIAFIVYQGGRLLGFS